MAIYLSLAIILVYVVYCIITTGVPHSLSATYYKTGWVFSATLSFAAALILPAMLSKSGENYEFLAFIAVSSVFFVAFAPNFKSDKLVDMVHTGAAIIALIASQLWVALVNPLFLLWWIPLIGYVIWGKLKGYKLLDIPSIKFVTEILMLFTIYSCLINEKL